MVGRGTAARGNGGEGAVRQGTVSKHIAIMEEPTEWARGGGRDTDRMSGRRGNLQHDGRGTPSGALCLRGAGVTLLQPSKSRHNKGGPAATPLQLFLPARTYPPLSAAG